MLRPLGVHVEEVPGVGKVGKYLLHQSQARLGTLPRVFVEGDVLPKAAIDCELPEIETTFCPLHQAPGFPQFLYFK